jgi:hypothetical protein
MRHASNSNNHVEFHVFEKSRNKKIKRISPFWEWSESDCLHSNTLKNVGNDTEFHTCSTDIFFFFAKIICYWRLCCRSVKLCFLFSSGNARQVWYGQILSVEESSVVLDWFKREKSGEYTLYGRWQGYRSTEEVSIETIIDTVPMEQLDYHNWTLSKLVEAEMVMKAKVEC